MIDALRYLIILTGYAFWVATAFFFLLGCYTCARQALADRAMRKAEVIDYKVRADEFNRQLRERLREGWKP